MTDCPKRQCLLSFLAVFAFMLAYEIFENNVLLASVYTVSASALRPVAQMDRLSTWYIVHTAILAGLFSYLYKHFSYTPSDQAAADQMSSCSYQRSIRFGAIIGLIMGVIASRSYTWLPVSMNITMAWFFSSLAEGVGVGLVLGFISSKNAGTCSAK